MEYASNGKGNLGVTLGAIGTGLGALGGNGLLSGILGGNSANYVSKDVFDLQVQLIDSQKNNAILQADLSSEKKMVEVFNAANDKIMNVREEIMTQMRDLDKRIDSNAAAQAVLNCGFTSANAVLTTQVNQLMGLTKIAIPNSNICPGWGTATVTVGTSTTTA